MDYDIQLMLLHMSIRKFFHMLSFSNHRSKDFIIMLCPQYIRFFLLAAVQRQPFRKIGNTADLFTPDQIQSDKTAQRQCLIALQLIASGL